MAPVRRWLPFTAAALATVLLAGGFGLAADRLVTPQLRPAPQLKTVPAATLARLDITLAAPDQPLYCGVADEAVSRGWLRSGTAGCAISQSAAESAARQGGQARVVESVLAQVSSTRLFAVGGAHLAWVVVTQQSTGSCPQAVGGWAPCTSGRGGVVWNQLVVVDGHSAGVVGRLRLGPAAGRPQPRFYPPGASTAT